MMKPKKCKYCNKKIEGHTEKQIDSLMNQHLISKHSEMVELRERKNAN